MYITHLRIHQLLAESPSSILLVDTRKIDFSHQQISLPLNSINTTLRCRSQVVMPFEAADAYSTPSWDQAARSVLQVYSCNSNAIQCVVITNNDPMEIYVKQCSMYSSLVHTLCAVFETEIGSIPPIYIMAGTIEDYASKFPSDVYIKPHETTNLPTLWPARDQPPNANTTYTDLLSKVDPHFERRLNSVHISQPTINMSSTSTRDNLVDFTPHALSSVNDNYSSISTNNTAILGSFMGYLPVQHNLSYNHLISGLVGQSGVSSYQSLLKNRGVGDDLIDPNTSTTMTEIESKLVDDNLPNYVASPSPDLALEQVTLEVNTPNKHRISHDISVGSDLLSSNTCSVAMEQNQTTNIDTIEIGPGDMERDKVDPPSNWDLDPSAAAKATNKLLVTSVESSGESIDDTAALSPIMSEEVNTHSIATEQPNNSTPPFPRTAGMNASFGCEESETLIQTTHSINQNGDSGTAANLGEIFVTNSHVDSILKEAPKKKFRKSNSMSGPSKFSDNSKNGSSFDQQTQDANNSIHINGTQSVNSRRLSGNESINDLIKNLASSLIITDKLSASSIDIYKKSKICGEESNDKLIAIDSIRYDYKKRVANVIDSAKNRQKLQKHLWSKTAVLNNPGNYCFFNSAFHLLRSLPLFYHFLCYEKIKHEKSKLTTSPKFTFLMQILKFMKSWLLSETPRKELEDKRDGIINLIGLDPLFQHDVSELLNIIVNKISEPPFPSKVHPRLTDLFFTTKAITSICSYCEHIDIRHESEFIFNVRVLDGNPISINEAIVRELLPEMINQHKCSHCNRSTTLHRYTSVKKWPLYLLVQTNRVSRYGSQKVKTPVLFTTKLNPLYCNIDFKQLPFSISTQHNPDDPICSAPPPTYRLCSVIYHKGNYMNSAHYVAQVHPGSFSAPLDEYPIFNDSSIFNSIEDISGATTHLFAYCQEEYIK